MKWHVNQCVCITQRIKVKYSKPTFDKVNQRAKCVESSQKRHWTMSLLTLIPKS